MKILAFLQNPWFSVETDSHVIERYRTDQVFHRRYLRGTLSGNRLSMAFSGLYEQIHWDNVSSDLSNEANDISAVDMKHVETTIRNTKPQLILTFGQLAKETIRKSLYAQGIPVMECHHPNARGKTQADLDLFVQKITDYITDKEKR